MLGEIKMSNNNKHTKRSKTLKAGEIWEVVHLAEGLDFCISREGTGSIEWGTKPENHIKLHKSHLKAMYRFLKTNRAFFK